MYEYAEYKEQSTSTNSKHSITICLSDKVNFRLYPIYNNHLGNFGPQCSSTLYFILPF